MKHFTSTPTVTQADRDKARELTNQGNAQTALAKETRKHAQRALRRGDHRTFEKYATREMGHADNAQSAYAAARRLLDPTGE